MAFTPLTGSQPISYASARNVYRNSARESLAGGVPVFYAPYYANANYTSGYGGPRYKFGYTYYNSPYPDNTYYGNCTWWCWARLYETMGTALDGYGNAQNWYSRYTGSKDTNANNIQAGDIIVLNDSNLGHVMFVERVVGNTITISQSAYSQRSVWRDMACLVTTYSKSEIYQGNQIDMYKNLDSPAWETVIGVIHTGGTSPTPPGPTPTTTPSVSVSPSSASATMNADATYVDFNFTITVTGIPEDETASDAISFSSNCFRYAYTTGWIYSSYTVSGVTYRTGVRSLIVRYERLHDYAYTDTAYMYYRKTFSNGSVNSSTPMYITIRESSNDDISIISSILLKRRKKRFNVVIN